MRIYCHRVWAPNSHMIYTFCLLFHRQEDWRIEWPIQSTIWATSFVMWDIIVTYILFIQQDWMCLNHDQYLNVDFFSNSFQCLAWTSEDHLFHKSPEQMNLSSTNYFKKSRGWDNLACVLLKQQRLKSFPVYHCQCLCEVTGWHIVCSHWRLSHGVLVT